VLGPQSLLLIAGASKEKEEVGFWDDVLVVVDEFATPA
jgi:hypothetical protein